MTLTPAAKKILVIVLVNFLILVGASFFITKFLLAGIKNMAQEYLTGQETLFILADKENLVGELRANYQESQPDLKKISGVFLDSADVVGFITDLEKTAAQTGNQLSFRPVPANEEDIFMEFDAELKGSFNGLVHFLVNLEDTPYPPYRLIEVVNLAITDFSEELRFEENQSPTEVKTVLRVRIYTQQHED